MNEKMTTIKIIKGFFNEKIANRIKSTHEVLAIEQGLDIVNIDVVEACVLCNKNTWFKSKVRAIGKPVVGQFMVVIYYKVSENFVALPIQSKQNAAKRILTTIKAVVSITITEAAQKAKEILKRLSVANNTHLVTTLSNIFPELQSYYSPIAA